MWRTRRFVCCAVQLEAVLICSGELTRGEECEVLFVVWRKGFVVQGTRRC